jgi:hypothetical protein
VQELKSIHYKRSENEQRKRKQAEEEKMPEPSSDGLPNTERTMRLHEETI